MKFLKSEYKSIKQLIELKGLNIDSFSFTKRKGNLCIRYKNNSSEFVLHRKTETVLDTDKKWTKQSTYQIYHPTRIKNIYSWNKVLVEFENWMDLIMKN